MISVIIPVLNEAKTIRSVVQFARRAARVREVIVVDDGSIDGTPEIAAAAGARVITSSLLGKGASMEDGLRAARGNVLVYLDGDLRGLRADLIERITAPILHRRADFVKASFSRRAGRVTMLTARPLLAAFFPELTGFLQPLGGIIAVRRTLLRHMQFETDYGVDIGLLIDAVCAQAQLAEVDIGHIEHDSSPLEALGDMAHQVARTILERAAACGRLRPDHLQEINEVRHQAELTRACSTPPTGTAQDLALIDMDGALLQGRFAVELAARVGRRRNLQGLLDNYALSNEERARRIAAVFTGVPRSTFEDVARQVPLANGARQAVIALRKAGFHVGIVTDGYSVVAEIVRRRVFADFGIGHHMKFRRGRATGQLTFSPAMFHADDGAHHIYCRRNALAHLMDKLDIGPEHVVAVGDDDHDIWLLEAAGRPVAMHPQREQTRDDAQCVGWSDLSDVLTMVQE